MLNQRGFDLWADGYDQSVQVSEENDHYPFAGYKQILNAIYNEIMTKESLNILDIGFGTGVLTGKLYDAGHRITGLDFSDKMIQIAKEKMPNATLIQYDLTNGFPDQILTEKYDYIVSTYALHHFTDAYKVQLLEQVLPMLTKEGKLLIGDVSFQTEEDHNRCRDRYEDVWDDDEYYFVLEEIKQRLAGNVQIEYEQLSHCGGVFSLTPRS
ncbi:class I SAM-dependent methyltransferase [Geomicrobium sp. JCM 19055]|uniref:class I SAM-dependent DNA methyltransferase n=1 Tax=Geomicrobium sp. JCM 19055 TaxID=1460649 RepID=UPI00045ECF1C|nr:class I SAM-dependent methyltransferase [Geomicrobium sp. JCM 19055]GAJ97804.1 SAM-dependent methlytransferase YrrT [Geomicrobium sp. JCM 19055]